MMTKGLLFHAENNEKIDYVELAIASSLMAKTQMNVPAALVVDGISYAESNDKYYKRFLSKAFNEIIIIPPTTLKQERLYVSSEEKARLSFNNENRINIYDYTPFDETLILDVDYLVYDDSLNSVWGNEHLMISSEALSVLNNQLGIFDQRLFDKGIKMRWATVFYFKKGPVAKLFFDLLKQIRKNYSYYIHIYQTRYKYYRNDYSFSIAAHMLNSFNDNGYAIKELPIKILTSMPHDKIHSVTKDYIQLISKDFLTPEYLPVRLNTNVHILNKFDLMKYSEEIIKLYV